MYVGTVYIVQFFTTTGENLSARNSTTGVLLSTAMSQVTVHSLSPTSLPSTESPKTNDGQIGSGKTRECSEIITVALPSPTADEYKTFYRATLCISAVFAVARCPSVNSDRLSIRPSRWWIVSRRMKVSSNFFLCPVAPSLLFLFPCADTQLQGKPLQRGAKYKGGKILRFSTEIAVYLRNGTR